MTSGNYYNHLRVISTWIKSMPVVKCLKRSNEPPHGGRGEEREGRRKKKTFSSPLWWANSAIARLWGIRGHWEIFPSTLGNEARCHPLERIQDQRLTKLSLDLRPRPCRIFWSQSKNLDWALISRLTSTRLLTVLNVNLGTTTINS